MKIVITHTDFRIYWPPRLLALHKLLKALGHTLFVIEIAGKGSPYAFEKVKTKSAELNWHILFPESAMEEINSRSIQSALRAKLQELNPDVVIAGAIAFQSGAGALKWKARTGRPVILFDDARPEDVKRNRLVNFIKKTFYQNVDAVICPALSHSIGFEEWGIKKERIFYGIDVVDNELFKKSVSKDQLPSEIDKIHQPFVLAIGRQIEKKNWQGLLKAFVRYKTENPTSLLNLVFIGDGLSHSSLVAEAKEREDIVFIPFVQQDNIVQYYHRARGLILPSRYGETWGLVVNEAMAAGLPVLVSNQCGCANTLVYDGINGWTFEPEHTGEILEAIRKLDQLTQAQWERMSQSSEDIIKEWGLPRFTKGVLDALIYITTKPKVKTGGLGRILIHFWNGRYRPA
jgi:glycosyltransferase involved in cell wall biosynthesis